MLSSWHGPAAFQLGRDAENQPSGVNPSMALEGKLCQPLSRGQDPQSLGRTSPVRAALGLKKGLILGEQQAGVDTWRQAGLPAPDWPQIVSKSGLGFWGFF